MGKADKRQAKLSFSGGEKRFATSDPQPGDADAEEGSSEMSVRAMFMELKTSLAGIDAKLDHVTERLDRIRARVDDHDARFETLETHTSEIEDARSGDREQIAQMERLLEVIRNKNEDLEARSRRVQAQRRAFLPIKRLLSQAGIGFALLYPAKLRVRHEGKVLYFTDPKQANKFVRRLPKQRGAGTPGGVSPENASLSDND
ncbi:hypothetical protein NDU88_002823 [Pleurodeles waltl]|uniref:Uncharacterized protein n=1 Tax=Pleurodeles waltl TaxID=8319 RepID=A0AAV7VEN6_PLEWA|nr:hypothetical protein NDU88_002823 [Pleurodeles waltl]